MSERGELRRQVAQLEDSETKRLSAAHAGKRAEEVTPDRRVWLPAAGMFFLFCLLSWLDEIFDLPHLLLGAPRTPINWHEAVIEMVLIASVGLFAVLRLMRDVTERKRVEEALRRSLEETTHGQRLLLALSQANQTVQRASTPEEVYRAVGDEVAMLGYNATIFVLTDDRAHLAVRYLTFEPALVRAAEKLTGLPVQDYRLPLVPGSFFQRIIAEGETTLVEWTNGHVAEALPGPVRPLADQLGALLGTEQSIVAPLMTGSETVGLLAVSSASLTEADVPAVTAFASQAAIAIKNACLYQAEREQRELAEALAEAAAAVSSTLDLDQVLDRILEQVERVVVGDAFNIMLIQDGHARVVRWRGYEHLGMEDRIARLTIPSGEYPNLVKMVQTREPVVVSNTAVDPDWVMPEGWEWLRSYVGAPIQVAGLTVGLLNVDGTRPGQFGPADARWLKAFADHAAAAIENAQLYQELCSQFEQVCAGEERLRSLSRQLVEVQELERRHIARELHDEVGQALTGLKLLLEMSVSLPDDAGRASLGEAQALVNELVAQVRDLSLDLRPAMLDDLGLLPALLWHFKRYTALTNVRVTFKHAGLKDRRFAPQAETAAYRIVQEALTNVARHAGVSEVTVRLRVDRDTLNVQVGDQGTGFDYEAALTTGTASGLVGMRERVKLLGGQLTVETTPGAGTYLMVELPLDEPVQQEGE